MDVTRAAVLVLIICFSSSFSKAQVKFDPDLEEDIQLQVSVLTPPVEVTTVNCHPSAPQIKVQYVTEDGNSVVWDIIDISGYIFSGSACGYNQNQYGVTLSDLSFIADPELVGGTFRLKATVDNNEGSSTLSRRTYSFPAPFNLTGSSSSAVINSPFTWTCHVTSDYPVIEWYRGNKNLGQAGFLSDGSCVFFGQDDSYIYNCRRPYLTYTLTLPGSDLTADLHGSLWRCRDVRSEINGSKYKAIHVETKVAFEPDPEEDVQLQEAALIPPVEVTTIHCYSSSPQIKVQYVSADDSNIVFDIIATEGYNVTGSRCAENKNQYRVKISNLRFIADPVLVGGTFKLKATLNNDDRSSVMSRRTYSFPAPFNLTGSSTSAVINSPFTWTCHVTSDYPAIEWYRDSKNLGQVGILPDGRCETSGQDDTYIYKCQSSNLTYTLAIPGSSLTIHLHDTTWRCRDPHNNTKGSQFIRLYVEVDKSESGSKGMGIGSIASGAVYGSLMVVVILVMVIVVRQRGNRLGAVSEISFNRRSTDDEENSRHPNIYNDVGSSADALSSEDFGSFSEEEQMYDDAGSSAEVLRNTCQW